MESLLMRRISRLTEEYITIEILNFATFIENMRVSSYFSPIIRITLARPL